MTPLLHILVALRSVRPLMMPEPTLLQQIRIAGDAIGTADFQAALRDAESQRLAVSVQDTLTRVIRWKITDAGVAALAERNL